MNHFIKLGAAAAIAATTIGFTAHAADAESKWSLGDNNGKSFLYMSDPTGPSVTLNCSERMGVQAVIYINGNDMDNLQLNPNYRLSTRTVEMSSDSTETKDGTWGYYRSAKTLISTRGWQGKRIFNAAVSGSPVTLDITRVGEFTITPPAVNDEFKSFVADCSSI
jgi:hypothetical protein